MSRIAFIVNPVSGNKKIQDAKRALPEMIAACMDEQLWQPEIVYTQRAGHATELARGFADSGYEAVVACGGDGTVNEVACGLRDTKTAMGILPMGSGNGLARHLQVPMDIRAALRWLNTSKIQSIDYGLVNERLFVCTCGTGLDAMVADRFAASKRRGFISYILSTLRLLMSYRPQCYHLKGEGIDHTQRAFLITFANANQWGNNALIAPKADISDGKMDVMLMSAHALWGSAVLAIRLFAGTIDRSPLMTLFRTPELVMERESAAPFHIDGDPVAMPKDIRIRIVHHGLRVLAHGDSKNDMRERL